MSFSTHISKDVNMHNKLVYDIKWNSEGNYVGTVSNDKTVKIGHMESNGNAKTLQSIAPTTIINQICWHPTDGSRFALCGDDKYIELWDVRASRPSSKIKSIGMNINISWSPDGNFLALGNRNDYLTVLDLRSATQVAKYKAGVETNELSWSANSDFILAASGGEGIGSVDLFQFSDQTSLVPKQSFTAHASKNSCLKIDSTCSRLAVGGADCQVSLWDLDDMVCHHTVAVESDIKSISYSGDGSHIAAVSDDLFVLIANSDSGECVAKISTRVKTSCVAWNPKQNVIAIAPDDRGPVPSFVKFISFPSN